jgi:hypothetical protein
MQPIDYSVIVGDGRSKFCGRLGTYQMQWNGFYGCTRGWKMF